MKERLGLPRRLRELDAEIEATELALRRTICGALNEKRAELPPHVLRKVDERIQAALKKNPALDAGYYEALDGMLEYADLRELEATITNRGLRPLFQSRFPNTEQVVKRFDQLAELRNAIRHSRTVDDVSRKEGEAALLWFEQVLSR